MERKLMDEIIALEISLKEHIGEERLKAARWLDEEKKRLDAEVRVEDECCSREVARGMDAARREALAHRDKVLAEARSMAERIRAVPDGELRAIVSRHVGKVLR